MPFPYTDNFDDGTSLQVLTAHTPTGATAWQLLTGSSNSGYCWGLNSLAYGSAGAAGYYHISDTPPSADYYARADIIAHTLANQAGVMVRAQDGVKTAYFAWYSVPNTRWELYSWKAGVLSALLGSFTQTLTVGATYSLELRAFTNGANVDLEVRIDGTTRITATDSTSPITGAGHPGLVLAGNTSALCLRVDNFRAAELVEISAATSGTVGGGCTETLIHDTGGSFVITLTGDTWQPTLTDPMKLSILQGIDSDLSYVNGWNAKVRDVLTASAVVRTSSTVVTITIPATAAYQIVASETLTITIPSSTLVTSASDLVAVNRPLITDISAGTVTCSATFLANRVYQRGTDIPVSGTYTGTPGGIRCRLVDPATGAPMSGYETVAASVTGGTWSGTFHPPAATGPAKIEASFVSDSSVVGTTSGSALFGLVFALSGQSNAWYWTHAAAATLTGNPDVRWAATSWADVDGFLVDPLIEFANTVNTATGFPVAVIAYAVSGTALHPDAAAAQPYWGDSAGSLYTTLKSYIDGRSSSRIEGVLWGQGEQDASSGLVTQAEYESALTAFVNQMRADFVNGSPQPNLPFYVFELGRLVGGNDANWQGIRDAQRAVASAMTDVYLSSTLMDLPLRDTIHYTDPGQIIVARRVAARVNEVLGLETSGRGPFCARWSRSGAQVVVDVTHRAGSDFTPTTSITGFQFLDNGSPISILSAVRTSATQITLTLASAPVSGVEVLRYLYGANPTISSAVLDNSSRVLPLEANGSIPSVGPALLASSATASAVAAAVLTTAILLSGLGTASATASGDLQSGVSGQTFSANASATATALGNLTTAILFAGTATVSAIAQGSLQTLLLSAPKHTKIARAGNTT